MDKGLAAQAFPAAQLDNAEAAIIDQPARSQRLDSGALQNHLRDLGFPPPSVVCGADRQQQRNPSAGRHLARAVEGLLHVMGVLRERDEVREKFDGAPAVSAARGWMRRRPILIELLSAESRPKIGIGMFPLETMTGGLAIAWRAAPMD